MWHLLCVGYLHEYGMNMERSLLESEIGIWFVCFSIYYEKMALLSTKKEEKKKKRVKGPKNTGKYM